MRRMIHAPCKQMQLPSKEIPQRRYGMRHMTCMYPPPHGDAASLKGDTACVIPSKCHMLGMPNASGCVLPCMNLEEEDPCMSYEEEDTCGCVLPCMTLEEEDPCMSYEEEDTCGCVLPCMTLEEEDPCMSYEEEDTCGCVLPCVTHGMRHPQQMPCNTPSKCPANAASLNGNTIHNKNPKPSTLNPKP
jgi:hypothetical protein